MQHSTRNFEEVWSRGGAVAVYFDIFDCRCDQTRCQAFIPVLFSTILEEREELQARQEPIFQRSQCTI